MYSSLFLESDDCDFFIWEDDLQSPLTDEHMKNKDAIIEQLTEEKKGVLEKKNKEHQLKMEAMASREKTMLISCLLSIVFFFVISRV